MTTNLQNNHKRTIKKLPVKGKTKVDPVKRRTADNGALFTDERKTLQSKIECDNKTMPTLLCRKLELDQNVCENCKLYIGGEIDE